MMVFCWQFTQGLLGALVSDTDQKIVGFDVWHLDVPVVSRRDHGIGAIEGGFEVVVLRLTAEDGNVGWGGFVLVSIHRVARGKFRRA